MLSSIANYLHIVCVHKMTGQSLKQTMYLMIALHSVLTYAKNVCT